MIKMIQFEYLQLAIFLIGIISIIIAGYQDKKNRLAPAIYVTPTLIGFGINPLLGVVGLVGTMLALVFYKESWNEKLGLADLLLFYTLILAMFNPVTLIFVLLITGAFIVDLLWIQKTTINAPLIYIFSKWLIIVGIIALVITLVV
jgi:hypothetical protein